MIPLITLGPLVIALWMTNLSSNFWWEVGCGFVGGAGSTAGIWLVWYAVNIYKPA